MEQVVAGVVDHTVVPVADAIAWAASSGVLLAVFAALWLAFGAALVMSQGSLDQAWQWLRTLPIVIQAVVWLLFLPFAAGLWVWETTWPLAVRLLLVVGLAGWSILMFIPHTASKG